MSRPSGAPPATNDPASPSCNTLDCLHCSVRHLAVCSALSPDEVQALEQVTVSQQVSMGSTLARTGEERDHVYTLTGGALRLVRTLADGRRQINGFVLPGDYLGLSGSDHHRYDIEAIADSRVCRVALPQMKALRGRLSGLAQPTYVLDVPGGHGKVPVGPNYLSDDPGALVVEDVFGGQHRYPG